MSAECYETLADAYEARAEASRKSIRATLNTYLFPLLHAGSEFLDVGCAVGVACEEAALAGHDAVGVDISPRMIQIAKQNRQGHCRFLCLDYRDFAFGPVDAILAFAFVHLFPKSEAPALLAKMYSELHPGGYLYTGTTVESKSSEGMEEKEDYKVDAACPAVMPKRYRARYTAKEYERLVLSVGFEPVEINEHTDEFGKLWRDVLVRRPA